MPDVRRWCRGGRAPAPLPSGAYIIMAAVGWIAYVVPIFREREKHSAALGMTKQSAWEHFSGDD